MIRNDGSANEEFLESVVQIRQEELAHEVIVGIVEGQIHRRRVCVKLERARSEVVVNGIHIAACAVVVHVAG